MFYKPTRTEYLYTQLQSGHARDQAYDRLIRTLRRRPTHLRNEKLPLITSQSMVSHPSVLPYQIRAPTNHVIAINKSSSYDEEVKRWRELNPMVTSIRDPIMVHYHGNCRNEQDSYIIPSISTIQMRRPKQNWGFQTDVETETIQGKKQKLETGFIKYKLPTSHVEKTEVEHFKDLERGYKRKFVRFWGPPASQDQTDEVLKKAQKTAHLLVANSRLT